MKRVILYVDDELSNLRIFKDTFRRDFDVLLASSGAEALEILQNKRVDVVITDQRMPGMSGVELLAVVNSRFPSIPPNRVILSGFAEDADIKLAFDQYRLSRFIPKPWDYDVLKLEIINAFSNIE